MGRIAQSLGVDTRSPNGDDHWWDTHVKSEKWNKRRHTANFISASSFPPLNIAIGTERLCFSVGAIFRF